VVTSAAAYANAKAAFIKAGTDVETA